MIHVLKVGKKYLVNSSENPYMEISLFNKKMSSNLNNDDWEICDSLFRSPRYYYGLFEPTNETPKLGDLIIYNGRFGKLAFSEIFSLEINGEHFPIFEGLGSVVTVKPVINYEKMESIYNLMKNFPKTIKEHSIKKNLKKIVNKDFDVDALYNFIISNFDIKKMIDKTYNELGLNILNNGFKYLDPNRKKQGINRIQIPHHTLIHNFKDGFPAIQNKKLFWEKAFGECIGFIKGYTHLKDLHKLGVTFWYKDALNFYNRQMKVQDSDFEIVNLKQFRTDIENDNLNDVLKGELGYIYSHQMRNWNNDIDQLKNVISDLIKNPLGSKRKVTMWNPSDKDKQCLSPCHWSFELITEKIDDGYGLTLKWHQDSVDYFLGLPINIAYYGFLCHIIAMMVNMKPIGIIGDLSNVHIYEPHTPMVKEQLSRDLSKFYNKKLELSYDSNVTHLLSTNGMKAIDENMINLTDFNIKDYNPYSYIKAEMYAYDD